MNLRRKWQNAGYYVIGHDHLGHGDSVNSMEELGHLGEDGAVLWLKDMELVRRMAVAAAPNLPYIMLGHSMGSFLARRYLIYHGERIDGSGAYRNRTAAISYGEAGTF